MPQYDLTCGHTANISFIRFDGLKSLDWPIGTCDHDCVGSRPITVNPTTFYGAWRIGDKTFSDASEASGEEVKSTHDIDRLERQGKMYAITNPSRHRNQIKG